VLTTAKMRSIVFALPRCGRRRRVESGGGIADSVQVRSDIKELLVVTALRSCCFSPVCTRRSQASTASPYASSVSAMF
jgi:hypothetical protein